MPHPPPIPAPERSPILLAQPSPFLKSTSAPQLRLRVKREAVPAATFCLPQSPAQQQVCRKVKALRAPADAKQAAIIANLPKPSREALKILKLCPFAPLRDDKRASEG